MGTRRGEGDDNGGSVRLNCTDGGRESAELAQLDTHATIAKLVVVVALAVVLLAVVVGTTATSVSVSTSAKLVVVSVSTPPRGVVVVEVLTNAVVVGTKALVVVVVNRVLASPVVSGTRVDRVSMARVLPRALVDWETMMVSPSCEAG